MTAADGEGKGDTRRTVRDDSAASAPNRVERPIEPSEGERFDWLPKGAETVHREQKR